MDYFKSREFRGEDNTRSFTQRAKAEHKSQVGKVLIKGKGDTDMGGYD